MNGSMAQSAFLVVVFVVVLALFPLALKWLQRRGAVPGGPSQQFSRIVSQLAVGPQQRVVTVEVGAEGARTWLVLGVTASSITCLHTLPAPAGGDAPVAHGPLSPFAALLGARRAQESGAPAMPPSPGQTGGSPGGERG